MIAKILKITDQDGKPKTDGRYPMRVGAIVDVYPLKAGQPLFLDYIADGAGNFKYGVLKTSTVQAVETNTDAFMESGTLRVKTHNSIYYFEMRKNT